MEIIKKTACDARYTHFLAAKTHSIKKSARKNKQIQSWILRYVSLTTSVSLLNVSIEIAITKITERIRIATCRTP